MSSLTSTISGSSNSPDLGDAEGYLLLTIQDSNVKQVIEGQAILLARGELRIECVSVPIPPEVGHQTANPFAPSPSDPPVPTHDFWLILKIGESFEKVLIPKQHLQPLPQPVEGVQYHIPSEKRKDMYLNLMLPKPSSSADLEDLESFEVLLRQYECLGEKATALDGVEAKPLGSSTFSGINASSSEPLPEAVRGKLLLVNEDNGEIIGEMDQEMTAEEGANIAATDKSRPVVLDFGGDIQGYSHSVKVKTFKEEDMDDWMLRGAHNLSTKILSFGQWSSKKMNEGSEAFIRNTTPRAEPVKFSPTTKNNIRKAHNASAKSLVVTKKTMKKIDDAIGKVIDVGFEKGIDPAVEAIKQRRGSRDSLTGSPMLSGSPRSGSLLASPVGRRVSPSTSPITGDNSPEPRNSLESGVSALELDDKLASSPQAASPPIPPKPSHLSPGRSATSPPSSISASPSSSGIRIPLAQRLASVSVEGSDPNRVIGRQIPIPEDGELFAKQITEEPRSFRDRTTSSSSSTTDKAKSLFKRFINSAEVVLSSVEATTSDLITNGTNAAASAAHHKYGPDAGQATALLGGSVRNAVVIFVDARGVGRKAIVTRTAKGVFKGGMKLANGKEVHLQGEGEKGEDGRVVEAGQIEETKEGDIVVGVPQEGNLIDIEDEKGFRVETTAIPAAKHSPLAA
ncbi:hypothetical protein BD324DRAFT_631808 [Kockovaella imperatae]|uniref:Senescence domain-containing protein n=1 Tax=Kockovaella imperatae TaxID=4999 RepID=A0A1Y1UCP8_9TREE|nr:hypothetical protein BD324DRAFT_631808 [Kockovaella imperatae]ORX35813.1 hypothetical protein BD324DRAFT_631808 [Kockovaella imperatae]